MDRPAIETTRRSWDYANSRFNARKGDYARALSAGRRALPDAVVELLDVASHEHVLHLMCNDGRELAFLALRAGCRGTGVDFSSSAIDFARDLVSELDLPVQFLTAELEEFLIDGPLDVPDVVLVTLGSLRWIADLGKFFQQLAKRLGPTTRIVVWDFHPIAQMLSGERKLVRSYPFPHRAYLRDHGVLDYARDPDSYHLMARRPAPTGGADEYSNPHKVWFAEYSFAAILNAAAAANLTVATLCEWDACWEERIYPWLVPDGEEAFRTAPGAVRVPATFALKLRVAG